jgi:hypothetical protein
MGLQGARRLFITVAAVVVGTLVLMFLGRFLWLSMGATEGSVPPASSMPLPAESEIANENTECASGGCWTTFEVRPPEGVTPEELATELGATPQARVPGSLLDPLTVWLWAEPRGDVLLVRADYWSSEWVP